MATALFERGETQILGVTTLNMLRMEQQLDTLAPETRKRYMHNYNFPPYSTGETGRVGSPKRREIVVVEGGHPFREPEIAGEVGHVLVVGLLARLQPRLVAARCRSPGGRDSARPGSHGRCSP